MKRISLRWKLVLVSGCLALATTVVLGSILHVRGERQLLGQLEKTLETKCDEVITVLESSREYEALKHFLIIETRYRYTPYNYFYQIRDARGLTLVRSENLRKADLPLPPDWNHAENHRDVQLAVAEVPALGRQDSLRIRTERVRLNLADSGPTMLIIQTAVSLGPLHAVVRNTLVSATLIDAGILGVVFLLLWFVTSAALRPVAAMSRKASQITATNLRERLPIAGRGDELDDLARVLNNMLDRLSGSMEQMEQFSADAAHQLRTPLTRIRGELELILRGEVAEAVRPDLERIGVEVDRLSRLCSRLLLLGRVDLQRGEMRNVGEPIDLKEIADELVEQSIPLARERSIMLSVGQARTAWIRGNRMLIVEALLNLLDNAIRCTPPGGSVVVSVEVNDRDAVLSVSDTGPGVPLPERERIFQPFYRIPFARSGDADEGSGLGLAIVRAIAQAHGGRVKLGESVGAGSVFRMTFPAHRISETASA
jgi:two-component system OmpR family sensor kinase